MDLLPEVWQLIESLLDPWDSMALTLTCTARYHNVPHLNQLRALWMAHPLDLLAPHAGAMRELWILSWPILSLRLEHDEDPNWHKGYLDVTLKLHSQCVTLRHDGQTGGRLFPWITIGKPTCWGHELAYVVLFWTIHSTLQAMREATGHLLQ